MHNFKPFFVTPPTPRGSKNSIKGLFLVYLHSVSSRKKQARPIKKCLVVWNYQCSPTIINPTGYTKKFNSLRKQWVTKKWYITSERLLWPIILADAHTLCFEQCITMSIFEFTDKNFYIWLKSRIQTNFLSSIHWNLWVIFQDQGDFRNEPSSSGSSSAVYFFA